MGARSSVNDNLGTPRRHHGEPVDPDAPAGTRAVAHVAKGHRLGKGSSDLPVGLDLEQIMVEDIETDLRRVHGPREELAASAAIRSDEQLYETPPWSYGDVRTAARPWRDGR